MSEGELRRAIARKRDGEALEPAVWSQLVEDAMAGGVADAPLAALLMACVLRGLEFEEIAALTAAFVASGDVLSGFDARTVDKHSSGGVADTASLVTVPLVAACGVPVAKLSGRALGHTGGTLDKLEAIPGVRTDLTPERFAAIVASVGCAIGAQSARLVPADRLFYALRDRTATVPGLGLIAASIVAKKIAGGAAAIVYDVKIGRGAFMRAREEAEALARTLVALSSRFGRRSVALVTDLNEPLGRSIGTGLEAIEAREFLTGRRVDPRLRAVALALAAAMLRLAGVAQPAPALAAALSGGRAYERFEAMLAAQGMTAGALAVLAPHPHATIVRARTAGVVAALDPVALGDYARDLTERAGPGAGIVLEVRAGVPVAAGAPLAVVYGDEPDLERVAAAFTVADAAPPPAPLVYVEIDSRIGAGDAPMGTGGAPRSTLESRYRGRALT